MFKNFFKSKRIGWQKQFKEEFDNLRKKLGTGTFSELTVAFISAVLIEDDPKLGKEIFKKILDKEVVLAQNLMLLEMENIELKEKYGCATSNKATDPAEQGSYSGEHPVEEGVAETVQEVNNP